MSEREVNSIAARLQGELDRADLHENLDRLAALAAAGSGPALDQLLLAIVRRRLVDREVRSVLGDSADADDTVQAALVAVGLKIGTFEGRAHVLTWIGAIVTNEVRMTLRRRTRRSEPVSGEIPERDPAAPRISSLVADEQRYQAALHKLPVDHRQVLVLREIEQLDYETIATTLSIPIGTVRSRLHRARAAFLPLLLGSEPS